MLGMCPSHPCLRYLQPFGISRKPISDLLFEILDPAERDELVSIIEKVPKSRSPVHHLEPSGPRYFKAARIHPPNLRVVKIVEDDLRASKCPYLFVIINRAPLVHLCSAAGRYPQRRWFAP